MAAIRAGHMIIVVDDEDRENEGDLTAAAEKVTPEMINFMARHGRGLICMPMTGERLDQLEIPLMVSNNSASFGTAFTVSIEAKRLDDDRDIRGRSRRDDPRGSEPGDKALAISRVPDTCFRSAPGTAASSCAPARRKRRSTSPALPDSVPPA